MSKDKATDFGDSQIFGVEQDAVLDVVFLTKNIPGTCQANSVKENLLEKLVVYLVLKVLSLLPPKQ